jgi:hypothetical protein
MMSERERWIVYPLLLFALGAALRDKFTQQVHTEELHAAKIACEELVVLDSDDPHRSVAKLLSAPSQNSASGARYGVLALNDSEGKEFCGVTNSQLRVNSIAITNPKNQAQPLALLTSAPQHDDPSAFFGSLLLYDGEGHVLWVTPTKPGGPTDGKAPSKEGARRLPPRRDNAPKDKGGSS